MKEKIIQNKFQILLFVVMFFLVGHVVVMTADHFLNMESWLYIETMEIIANNPEVFQNPLYSGMEEVLTESELFLAYEFLWNHPDWWLYQSILLLLSTVPIFMFFQGIIVATKNKKIEQAKMKTYIGQLLSLGKVLLVTLIGSIVLSLFVMRIAYSSQNLATEQMESLISLVRDYQLWSPSLIHIFSTATGVLLYLVNYLIFGFLIGHLVANRFIAFTIFLPLSDIWRGYVVPLPITPLYFGQHIISYFDQFSYLVIPVSEPTHAFYLTLYILLLLLFILLAGIIFLHRSKCNHFINNFFLQREDKAMFTYITKLFSKMKAHKIHILLFILMFWLIGRHFVFSYSRFLMSYDWAIESASATISNDLQSFQNGSTVSHGSDFVYDILSHSPDWLLYRSILAVMLPSQIFMIFHGAFAAKAKNKDQNESSWKQQFCQQLISLAKILAITLFGGIMINFIIGRIFYAQHLSNTEAMSILASLTTDYQLWSPDFFYHLLALLGLILHLGSYLVFGFLIGHLIKSKIVVFTLLSMLSGIWWGWALTLPITPLYFHHHVIEAFTLITSMFVMSFEEVVSMPLYISALILALVLFIVASGIIFTQKEKWLGFMRRLFVKNLVTGEGVD